LVFSPFSSAPPSPFVGRRVEERVREIRKCLSLSERKLPPERRSELIEDGRGGGTDA